MTGGPAWKKRSKDRTRCWQCGRRVEFTQPAAGGGEFLDDKVRRLQPRRELPRMVELRGL